MFGEVFDGNDELVGSYTQNDELDSTFYFPQKFVLEGVVKSGSPTSELQGLYDRRIANYCSDSTGNCEAVKETHGVYPTSLLVNFLDNHDVGRWLWTPSGQSKTPRSTLHAALMYQLTIDGIPCIYYGTEQNFVGGNDPANREDMSPSHFDTTNSTFKLMQMLIQLRKAYEPLRTGNYNIVYSSTGSDGVFAFERITTDGKKALVVLNFNGSADSNTTISTSLTGSLKNVFSDMDSNDDFSISGGQIIVKVPHRGVKILVPSADVTNIKSTFIYNPSIVN
jgi:alpha-amylase